jgi:hypothetical protein
MWGSASVNTTSSASALQPDMKASTLTTQARALHVRLFAHCQPGMSLLCQVGAAAAAAAGVSPYCDDAPDSVPQGGGVSFDKWEWIDACSATPRGANCTSTWACKAGGGPVTARCDASGFWEYLSGECIPRAACSAAPSSVPTSGGSSFLPGVWNTQCGQKKEGETCTVISCKCSTTGTISAKCTKVNQTSAVWTDIQGACNARVS